MQTQNKHLDLSLVLWSCDKWDVATITLTLSCHYVHNKQWACYLILPTALSLWERINIVNTGVNNSLLAHESQTGTRGSWILLPGLCVRALPSQVNIYYISLSSTSVQNITTTTCSCYFHSDGSLPEFLSKQWYLVNFTVWNPYFKAIQRYRDIYCCGFL